MRPTSILAFALSLLLAGPAPADGLAELSGGFGLAPDQLGFVVIDTDPEAEISGT